MNKLTSLAFCAGLLFTFGSPLAAQDHVHLHHDGHHHDVTVHDAQCHVSACHVAPIHNHCGYWHHAAIGGCAASHNMHCATGAVLHTAWQHTGCCNYLAHRIIAHQVHPHWGVNQHETYWHPHHISCHDHIVSGEHHAIVHSPAGLHSHDAVNAQDGDHHAEGSDGHTHYTATEPGHEHGEHQAHQKNEDHPEDKDDR